MTGQDNLKFCSQKVEVLRGLEQCYVCFTQLQYFHVSYGPGAKYFPLKASVPCLPIVFL